MCLTYFSLHCLTLHLSLGELQDHTTVRGNDFVPGSTVQLRVWPMYQELIEAVVSNEIDWVIVCNNSLLLIILGWR